MTVLQFQMSKNRPEVIRQPAPGRPEERSPRLAVGIKQAWSAVKVFGGPAGATVPPLAATRARWLGIPASALTMQMKISLTADGRG
jgi:hypothetical protein